ncbi:MAG: restriction endonuclease subunit S [Lactobacillus sp.]|nr:restriction endonuclease subunit S [Lactobacillus sp.]
MGEISERILRKNSDLQSLLPLTISAQDGLVDQTIYFNKQVASKQLKNYLLLYNGDFAYNKSYSVGYPYGAIKRLDKYKQGVLSTLYIAFKPTNINSDFLQHYYDTDKWYREIYRNAAEGARNHGLLNISANDFFNSKLITPSDNDEQLKIAKIINVFNRLITLQQRKLELLSQLKQGLIQQNILNQALLNSSSSWPSYKLKDLLKVRKKLQIPDIKYPLASFTVEKGVTSKTSRYNREFLVQTHNKKYKSTEYHDIVYNPANLKFGAIALNKFGKATISPIYETLVPSSKCNVYFLTLIITSPDFIHKALKYQEGTVYERMAVKVNDLLSMSIHLPNIDTQVKFGEFFYGLDELIYATKNKLEKYQLIKKSLLQQMFI